MTKLTKIINIGIEKGFDCFGHKEFLGVNDFKNIIFNEVAQKNKNSYSALSYSYSLNDLIFSPDSNLLQALFGEENEWICNDGHNSYMPAYLFHQRQLLPLDDQERIKHIADALGVE